MQKLGRTILEFPGHQHTLCFADKVVAEDAYHEGTETVVGLRLG